MTTTPQSSDLGHRSPQQVEEQVSYFFDQLGRGSAFQSESSTATGSEENSPKSTSTTSESGSASGENSPKSTSTTPESGTASGDAAAPISPYQCYSDLSTLEFIWSIIVMSVKFSVVPVGLDLTVAAVRDKPSYTERFLKKIFAKGKKVPTEVPTLDVLLPNQDGGEILTYTSVPTEPKIPPSNLPPVA